MQPGVDGQNSKSSERVGGDALQTTSQRINESETTFHRRIANQAETRQSLVAGVRYVYIGTAGVLKELFFFRRKFFLKHLDHLLAIELSLI